jgi:hypothetical protein
MNRHPVLSGTFTVPPKAIEQETNANANTAFLDVDFLHATPHLFPV